MITQSAWAETSGLMQLPKLPEDTVLFEEEKSFGYRGRVGAFVLPPSKIGLFFDDKVYYPEGTAEAIPESKEEAQGQIGARRKSIKIMYQKEKKDLSFCGTYIVLLADIAKYKTITFMIKGEEGGESFEIGMNDTISNKREDAVYVGSINRYLSGGVTKEWQMVKIPLSDFFGPDLARCYSLVFHFNETGKGAFWIDQLSFSTDIMVDREAEINKKGYLLLDDFDHSLLNLLGNKTNAYKRLPSVCIHELSDEEKFEGTRSLKLTFDKKGSGWCGYYTLLNQIDGEYYDLSPYKSVSFMVKGSSGGEVFELGMADKNWIIIGDSLKAGPVEKYLPAGVTKEWQEVAIPLKDFGSLDLTEMGSFVINFYKTSQGVIYVDNLRFNKMTEEDMLKSWDEGF